MISSSPGLNNIIWTSISHGTSARRLFYQGSCMGGTKIAVVFGFVFLKRSTRSVFQGCHGATTFAFSTEFVYSQLWSRAQGDLVDSSLTSHILSSLLAVQTPFRIKGITNATNAVDFWRPQTPIPIFLSFPQDYLCLWFKWYLQIVDRPILSHILDTPVE